MKSELIAKRHWKWAANALNAANRDAVSRDPQNAVSRAYYAMMHAANAALAVKGLQAKTHKGTQTLFNEHLVQPGEVDKQRGRDLASGQRQRTGADYDVSRDVSESQAHEQCTKAATFLTEIRTHLRKAGLREDELGPVAPLPGSKPLQRGGDPSVRGPGQRPGSPASGASEQHEVPDKAAKRTRN